MSKIKYKTHFFRKKKKIEEYKNFSFCTTFTVTLKKEK